MKMMIKQKKLKSFLCFKLSRAKAAVPNLNKKRVREWQKQ